jgi:hypothetical protein
MEYNVEEFDRIRPYEDGEIQPALKRITEQPQFPSIVEYLFPGVPVDEIAAQIKQFTSVGEFQNGIMLKAIDKVIHKTVKELSFSGIENLGKEIPYLYVSNHRDIVLDSAIIQYILVNNGFDTGEIAFGDNLMLAPIFVDIAKTNKVLTVFRGGSMKERLENSRLLSKYIRYVITVKKRSLWIAQRNGRTKDGIDETDPGLLKMFHFSGEELGQDESLARLNIVPVSLSYEYEPCDDLKAQENILARTEGYEKKPEDDFKSILKGLKQDKGRVHVHFGNPLSQSMMQGLGGKHRNDFFNGVAAMIDKQIIDNYKLWPTNFISLDLSENGQGRSGEYTDEQKSAFMHYVKNRSERSDLDPEAMEKEMLKIYSNPIREKSNR